MGELLSKLFRQSILHRFFFRGCMSARRFYRSENMIIGPAVDEAAEYHTLPEWSVFGPFQKAGANVVLHFQENSGHELGYDEFSAAKDWLSNIPKNS